MLLALGLLALLQDPAPRPARARDTVRLDSIAVTVTRRAEAAGRVPAAVGVLDSADLRRGRVLNGLDEALGQLPGVVVANRYNASLDQRLVIRGAGSRAAFGIRGIKILIDGLPQTLPDGQSQLSNLDLGIVSRVEVLNGAASALYGNAAGGVVAFTTEQPGDASFVRVRAGTGGLGTTRAGLVAGGGRGDLNGLVSVTRLESRGFRQHSRSSATQATLAGNAILSPTWMARVRYFGTRSPEAQNPGALTAAELAAKPDSAAANNIRRGADKSVTQHQLGVSLVGATASGRRLELAVFGLTRDLVNPLATPPPGPASPTAGTYSAIDRVSGGARLVVEQPLGWWRGRLGLGVDAQTMRDDRLNTRSDAGRPTDTVIVDQRETVSEIGPFVTLHVEPTSSLLLTAAARYDRLRFAARDRLLSDGSDQSGARTLAAASGSLGASYTRGRVTGWTSVSSAFETPTTTELGNRPGGLAGFNDALEPQRATNVEAGVRWSGRVGGSVAAYRTTVRDGIVQAQEVGGRAYFENAGRLRHQGIEIGLDARPASWLRGRASYTHTDSRFLEYRLRSGATVDTLDGNLVPGIPRHALRVTAVATAGATAVELEQQVVSSQVADDRNAIVVDGWGAGVTALRISTRTSLGAGRRSVSLAPFAAVHNLFDRRYVGSVTVNGFGGRVFEPAAGRWVFVGVEVGWRGGSQ